METAKCGHHSVQTVPLLLPQPWTSLLGSGYGPADLKLPNPFFEPLDTTYLPDLLQQQTPEVHSLLCKKVLFNFKQISLFQLVPHCPTVWWLQLTPAVSLTSVFACLKLRCRDQNSTKPSGHGHTTKSAVFLEHQTTFKKKSNNKAKKIRWTNQQECLPKETYLLP